jgi:hypothetical protein
MLQYLISQAKQRWIRTLLEVYMKKSFLVILALMIILALAGCGGQQTPSPSPTPEVTPSPTPSPTPVPTIEVVPTPDPNISKTTGLKFTGEYKPVMVVIENSPSARPQTGLQTADVVYEIPVEGAITRFVCVFSDNIPEGVMPVRSGREPFLHIQREWNAAFMHYGGSGANTNLPYTFYGNEMHGSIKIDIDGMQGKWSDYYYRVKGKGAPHNVMGNPQMAQKLYDYSPEPLGWLFDANVSYQGDAVTEINLAMCSNDDNFVSYTYDATSDTYLRSMNGKAFKSAETDKQVSVKNIIAQYSTYDTPDIFKMWKLVGDGKADIYIGGKLIKGTWKKESEDSKTIYYDAAGKQIVLKPGNTWIELCPQK